ncbi:hypothetical protein C0993_006070, partial [Termitomyces sp. T159_Od127]
MAGAGLGNTMGDEVADSASEEEEEVVVMLMVEEEEEDEDEDEEEEDEDLVVVGAELPWLEETEELEVSGEG